MLSSHSYVASKVGEKLPLLMHPGCL